MRTGGYVSDPAGYLTAAERGQLNALIREIEDSTTAQIAVVLLPSIGRENPKDFATRLFSRWGIGQASTDNGLLVLSVMDQRRTEFETGYGMEAVLPDALCYRIGMQKLVPYFQKEQYGAGLLATLQEMRKVIENPSYASDLYGRSGGRASPRREPFGLPLPLTIYLGIALIFHLILIVSLWNILYHKGDLHDKYLAVRRWKLLIWVFLFPIPYLLVYFLLRNLLHKLRNKPRFSKKTGAPMRKLSEEEEDEFLEKGQITEEDIKSVDYDVWVAEDPDDILILRYARRFTKYTTCPECGYKTYYHAHTHTLKAATYSSSGLGEKVYSCKNCGYEKRKTYKIARKQRSGGGGFSGGGGGGGGGSWGGGSSGGGGGGVSW